MKPGYVISEVAKTSNLFTKEALVTIQALREYVSDLWHQYQGAGRRLKIQILDELCRNTKIHRKSAIRLMTAPKPSGLGRGKGNRKRKYDDETILLLKKVWKEMGYCGSKYIKAALDDWLDYFDEFSLQARDRLKKMAASTMDIYLREDKSALRRRLNSGTKRSKGKHFIDIPIRNLAERPKEIGHCEVDLVAHCGDSMSGKFAWSLTLTDIASGWTENETVWGKDGFVVMLALQLIEKRLPFALKALYFDNGTEFLNDDVVERFARRQNREKIIPVFRSRPYKKNDQCHVEQKNFTHVRELFGYSRMSWRKGLDFMNLVYRKEWRILTNYFRPQIKLEKKWREGSKIKRLLKKPKTPVDYLIESDELSLEVVRQLISDKQNHNPRGLRKKLNRRLREFRLYLGKDEFLLTKQAA